MLDVIVIYPIRHKLDCRDSFPLSKSIGTEYFTVGSGSFAKNKYQNLTHP